MRLKGTAAIYSQVKEEVSISEKEIESLLDSLGEFFEAFDQANKLSQIPLPKPKFEIGFTKAKDKLFSHCYKDIAEHLNRQTRLPFQFAKNKICVFSNKTNLNVTVIRSIQSYRICQPGLPRSQTSMQKSIFLLLTSVTISRAITMCSTFTPDCGYDNSTIILIGDGYCPNTKCSGRVCLHKKNFQSLGRNDHQCPQCASVCQFSNILSEDQTISFLLSFGQGVYSFEESPKSIQGGIGDVYCPGRYCSNREKCGSLEGYVTTPRSIFGCKKYGAWLFVLKVPFMLQEHVKTTKTDKTCFFFVKKIELGTEQTIVT